MQKITPFLWFDNNAEEAMNADRSHYFGQLMQDKDPEKSKRVMEAMLEMDKIVIEPLKQAMTEHNSAQTTKRDIGQRGVRAEIHMNKNEVLKWLEKRGTRRTVEGMARYGIRAEHAFGVRWGRC